MPDRHDLLILDALQQDASRPLRELAELVHLSVASCQRRIAQLRASGLLQKEVALVDRERLGRALTVFVSVELASQNDALLRRFEAQMQDEADVQACYEISGEADFLLIVTAPSMAAFHAFTRRVFSADNHIRNFKSSFAMHCSKFETRIPLDIPPA